MRSHAHRLALVLLAFCAPAAAARAQEREYAEAPNLKLTVTAEKTHWRQGAAAPVRVRIENATGGRMEVPSVIVFRADNRLDDGGRVTTSEGVLWSPVSLTKSYGVGAKSCQNDLSPQRVKNVKGVVVEIHPDRGVIVLDKGGAKEFGFDLALTCWGHSISSFYPSSTVFEAAERFKPNSYRVYFSMQFPMRTGKPGDARYHQVKSNAVEVIIN